MLGRNKKTAIFFMIAVFLLSLDRFFKLLALKGFNQEIATDFFGFRLAKNYFMAFSLPLFGVWLNWLILAVILLFIGWTWQMRHKASEWLKFGQILLIFGAMSNLYDRLVYGFVVDYLDLSYFTVFNLADAMICFAAVLIIFDQRKKPTI